MSAALTGRDKIQRLLRPRHVAFFGGKQIEESVRYADEIGFRGELWVVNPTRDLLGRRKCFRSIDDLPTAPDASFIAVNPETAVEIVRQLAARGSAGAVCYAAGFKEIGAAGEKLERRLLDAAGSMAIVGPNAPGLINFFDRAAVTFDEKGLRCPEKGVAIITQSGSFADNSSRNDRGLPIGYLLSTGNQSMLEAADYMDVLLDDPRVTAIGLHMEGLRDVTKFHSVALRALERHVPIVVLKTGTSQRGADAASSHTAALAGNDELFSALFRRLGITRARTLTEFIETLKLFTVNGSLHGSHVAVMTCSGFDCSNAADVAELARVRLPDPSADQKIELADHLTEYTKPSNPLDCAMAMWGDRSRQAACFKIMMRQPYDCALLIVTFPIKVYGNVKDWDAAIEAFIDAKRATNFPCICVSNLPEGLPARVRDQLHSHGIAALQGLPEAFFAIQAASDYTDRRQFILGSDRLKSPPSILSITSEHLRPVDEWHSKKWLNELGIKTPRGQLVRADQVPAAAASVGYPVVLKASMNGLLHKSDVGAVVLGIRDEAEVNDAIRRICASIDGRYHHELEFVVEQFITNGLAEILVGIKRDPRFGLVLVIGSGGILAELASDVVRLILPTTREEVCSALNSLKVSALINGFRGRPMGDSEAIVDAVMRIAAAAEAATELAQLDVNPLIVLPKKEGVIAADALLMLEGETSNFREAHRPVS